MQLRLSQWVLFMNCGMRYWSTRLLKHSAIIFMILSLMLYWSTSSESRKFCNFPLTPSRPTQYRRLLTAPPSPLYRCWSSIPECGFFGYIWLPLPLFSNTAVFRQSQERGIGWVDCITHFLKLGYQLGAYHCSLILLLCLVLTNLQKVVQRQSLDIQVLKYGQPASLVILGPS